MIRFTEAFAPKVFLASMINRMQTMIKFGHIVFQSSCLHVSSFGHTRDKSGMQAKIFDQMQFFCSVSMYLTCMYVIHGMFKKNLTRSFGLPATVTFRVKET